MQVVAGSTGRGGMARTSSRINSSAVTYGLENSTRTPRGWTEQQGSRPFGPAEGGLGRPAPGGGSRTNIPS
ncbi:hypothetical protein GCM10018780_82990 [Streptomyces lanatus]|nr:hypothetical protein GCM10018780_82990 [Streptomyces lanatus]